MHDSVHVIRKQLRLITEQQKVNYGPSSAPTELARSDGTEGYVVHMIISIVPLAGTAIYTYMRG